MHLVTSVTVAILIPGGRFRGHLRGSSTLAYNPASREYGQLRNPGFRHSDDATKFKI